jgi:hypothetical protein
MASEKLKKKLAKRSADLKKRSSGEGMQFFSFKEGTTRMRLLFVGEDNEPGIEVKHVYFNQELKGCILPSTFGMKCAITAKYEKYKASKDPAEREIADKFKPKSKFFALAIRYKDEKGLEVDEQSGVKPVVLTSGQYQEILDLFVDDEQGDMTDPLTGYDLKFKRTGLGQMDTKYTVLPCKPTKCPKKYRGPYDIEAEVKKIIPSYEDTKDKITQFLAGVNTDSEDEEEAPVKKKKKRSSDI